MSGFREQGGDHRLECGVGDRIHLGVAAVLDRVLDVHRGRIGAERARLMLGAVDERGGRHEHARDPARFQIDDVVHTARRAGASVRERLHDGTALHRDLLA